MKKRWLAMILVLLLPLIGCTADVPLAEGPEETTGEHLIVVGISQIGAESDWRVANSESMKAVFTEQNGYRLLFDDAKQKQENQMTAIRKFIQQQVDYIILMPLTESGWDSVLQEAKEAGIPVILVDRMVKVEDESLFTAHVGSDFRKEGEKAVDWLKYYAIRKETDALNIVHIQGTHGSTSQIGRTAALESAVKRHGWNLLVQLNGDFTQAKTYEVLKEYLSQTRPTPRIDAVYCENDNEAFGAMEALEEAGYTCGRNGVAVISFDATRNGLTYCLRGKIALNVECNPLLGPIVENVIQTLEHGGTPEKYHYVPEQAFTRKRLTETFIAERPY